jgi:hypothetical protein
MKKVIIILICLFFFGCVIPLKQHLVSFNENDFIPYLSKGNSKIIGQAFLKTRGGDVKYGAGNEIVLVPFTPYTEERYNNIVINNIRMEQPDNRYFKYRRTTRADGQGNFEFTDIPSGEYILICNIYWEVGGRYSQTTGGIAHAKIFINPGETMKTILTR